MADPGRLDELKRKFEENPKRYFAPLANEYRKAGDPELAIELCRTYLPQQPTHMSGYIVYAQALHDGGHMDESAAVFRQALTLDPENLIALRHLGDISRDAGDKVGAMRWYGKVLELDPRNEEIASYITSLAQPGSKAVAPVLGRGAPPSIRPEPAPDEHAVRLEDIVLQPDVEQVPFVPDPASSEQFDGPVDDPFGHAEEPLRVTEIGVPEVSNSPDGPDLPPVLEGPWHAALDARETPLELAEISESEPQPLRFADFMPDEDAAFAPTPQEVGETLAVPAHLAESAPLPASVPEFEAAARDESPFVTETMAELYVRQGLGAEALGIYRQLAIKRDDPALRRRIAELESEQSAKSGGETVHEFFARIGTMRPAERVELAADRHSPLSALFRSGQPDAGDLSAAQRLSDALGNLRSGDSHS